MKKIYLGLMSIGMLLFPTSEVIAQTSTTFNYTGAMDTYIVPAGVTNIQIEAWGAQGQGGNGGLGGYVSGEMAVTPGQTLYIYVGGQDGFNGGGVGWSATPKNGGGASDVRTGGTTLNDRVIVAGGGGAGGPTDVGNHAGGDGGGGTVGSNYAGGGGGAGYGGTGSDGGVNGGAANTSCHSGGAGGGGLNSGGSASCNTCYTSTCGTDGTLGQGGAGDTWENGICYNNYNGTAGGGGGYYGGGGTSVGNCGSGAGGGGSSWTGTLTNQVLIGGQQTGDGQIIITVLCTPLTTTVSSNTVCEGEMVTLDASSVGTGTVTWDNGVTNGVAFTPPVGTTTYTATSTDGNDCGFSVDITVNALPTVVAGVDNAIICLGDTVVFTGSGASTYVWDNGVTDGADYIPGTSGLTAYTVTGTDVNGCENSDNVDVLVSDLSVTAVITHENTGNDGAIDITPVNGTGTYTYTWSSGPTSEDISGLTAGTYTLSIDDGACTFDSTFTVLNVAGISASSLNGLEVYPNPTNGQITIKLNGQFNYQLVNVIGEVLVTGSGYDQTDVDLSELSRGSYFIKVFANNEYKTIKVTKQ